VFGLGSSVGGTWVARATASSQAECRSSGGADQAAPSYPQIGRFISEDPIGLAGGTNHYAYVGNSPANATDPTGLFGAQLGGCLAGGALEGIVSWGTQRASGQKVSWGTVGKNFVIGCATGAIGGIWSRNWLSMRAINRSIVDPRTVRYTQDSVTHRFSGPGGHTITSTAGSLRSGNLDPWALPTVRLFERNGSLFSLDNRRLAAFQEAGVPMPFRMATSDEVASEAWKFTTTNDGRTVQYALFGLRKGMG
jgi:hypothetical protein